MHLEGVKGLSSYSSKSLCLPEMKKKREEGHIICLMTHRFNIMCVIFFTKTSWLIELLTNL